MSAAVLILGEYGCQARLAARLSSLRGSIPTSSNAESTALRLAPAAFSCVATERIFWPRHLEDLMRLALHFVTASVLALPLHAGIAGGADLVEMGPVQGTVQGHVWSKVINEAGQTQGRDEVWLLQLAAPASPEFIVLCPDPYPLEALVQWKTEYGESFEIRLDRVAKGFHKKFSSPWDPGKSRDIRIVISTKHAPADQRYQLTVNLLDASGRPQGAAVVSKQVEESFEGLWARVESGVLGDFMEISVTEQSVQIVFRDRPRGPETGRASGRLTAGRLEAANARRKIIATLKGSGRLAYTSTNLDGSSPWSGEFLRQP